MGLKVNGKVIHLLLFLDDQAVISDDEEDVMCTFYKLKDSYDEWGSKISMSKIGQLTASVNANTFSDDINIKTVEEAPWIYL